MRSDKMGSSNWVRAAVVSIFGGIVVLGMLGIIGAHAGIAPQYNALSAGSITGAKSASNSYAWTFTDSASGGVTPYTFVWNFGDGTPTATTTTASTAHTFTTAKNYTVIVTVTDSEKTPKSQKTQLLVSVYSTISPGTIVVSGSNLNWNFSDTTVKGTSGTVTYTWNFGDGTAAVSGSSDTASHTYTSGGNFVVLLTISDSAKDSSASARQTVNAVAPNNPNTGTGGSPNNNNSDLWIFIVILVIAVILIAFLVYRRRKNEQAPPPDQSQMGYDQYGAAGGAVAPYAYDAGAASAYPAPADGSLPPPPPDASAQPPMDGSMAPPPPSEGAPPSGGGPPPDAPPAPEASPPPAEPSADPAPSSSTPEAHTNCVVCGGPLDGGYCSQCNMDWNKGSSGSS